MQILAMGYGVEDDELLPMTVNGGSIECVIVAKDRINVEVDRQIVSGS